MKSPRVQWDQGGLNEVLIGLDRTQLVLWASAWVQGSTQQDQSGSENFTGVLSGLKGNLMESGKLRGVLAGFRVLWGTVKHTSAVGGDD